MSDTHSWDDATRVSAYALDDPDELENATILKRMKNHVSFRDHKHSYVIGTTLLPLRWQSQFLRIGTPLDGESLLRPLARDPSVMQGLRRALEPILSQCLAVNDVAVVDMMAQALASGRAWIIKDAKAPPFGTTSPGVCVALNGVFGTKVEFERVSKWEGGQRLRGYVPIPRKVGVVAGNSGMTIATGVDLGRLYDRRLKALALPDAVVAKFGHYVGLTFKDKTKAEVAAIVSRTGPVPKLLKDEADATDGAVFAEHLRAAFNSWNTRRKSGVPEFGALPSAWQTVLFSRTYNQGPGMPNTHVAQPFYSAATAGRWREAVQALRNYAVKDAWYKNRVGDEADLLQTDMPPAVDAGSTADVRRRSR